MSNDQLSILRAEIDTLDEELIRTLALRFIATGKIGVIKATRCLEAVDPSREAEQMRRYSLLALRHGVSIEVIQKVFRAIIDEVVVNHQAISESKVK
ncbi:chorismate mutase [Pseudomonas sp. ChxA]|uniref:chorismate mutase n=1 Tax=Pseudomonas fluorescens TaxID=294 RepID=A0A2T0HPX2_PSEFL|nr:MULTISPECIES: chorismate mutase [Pseudomonas]AOA05183.1 chorismate mutase [Pseudomonas sp. TMW 2.1634]MDL2185818.1 chorismate mutase [Pseudomonas sp. ChxA]MQT39457.1 chorismate mutase [Pseudomonas sp. FSL R10-0765]OOV90644.1 chorismate mutase [Pseudomonas sp. MF6394]PRW85144.1 chorismate mutase [Pseudomonas fluorescens]